MTEHDFKRLAPGDVVRHKTSGDAMVITDSVAGQRAIAVRTVEVTNPDEWDLIRVSGSPAKS